MKTKFKWLFFFFNSNSKWVVKHRRQLATPTMLWTQELLRKVQCSGDSKSFAKETRAFKMRSAVTTTGSWQQPTESHHWSWSSYNYTRSCQRIQHRKWKWKGFPGGSSVKNLPAMRELQESQFPSLGQEDPLEEGMATHSSILAWRIPGTEEPGGLQSIGSHMTEVA